MRLVPATVACVEAELDAPAALARHLDARLAPDWPPEHHDTDVLVFTRERLSDPAEEGWWLHYIVLDDGDDRVIVGTCGYKGPPVGETVEIGYSVVPSHQRRGIATEASRQLIGAAVERDPTITTVVADTLPHLEPSIGVLAKLGFRETDPSEPGVLRYRLDLDGRR